MKDIGSFEQFLIRKKEKNMRLVRPILLSTFLLFMGGQSAFANMATLMKAIVNKNVITIQEELKKQPNLINQKGSLYNKEDKILKYGSKHNKGTPLHQAVLTKDLGIFKAVVDSVPEEYKKKPGIRYGSTMVDGATVLHLAIERNVPTIVRYLLETTKIDPNKTSTKSKIRPFVYAIKQRNPELIKAFSSPAIIDKLPLVTLRLGHEAALLSDRKANDGKQTMTNTVEKAIFHALIYPINNPIRDQKFASIIETTSIGPALLKMQDKTGDTLLHFASQWSDLKKTMNTIIKLSPDLRKVKNNDGLTAFDQATATGENIPDSLKPVMTKEEMEREMKKRREAYKKAEAKRAKEEDDRDARKKLLEDIKKGKKGDKDQDDDEKEREIKKRLAEIRKKKEELQRKLAELDGDDLSDLTASLKSLKPKISALSSELKALE